MEINFPSLPPSSANQGMKVKRDSSMNKILKIVHQLKSLSSQKRCEKYEELIRYIMSIMLEKKSDSLLQTTSLWSLLNLIQLDSNYTIQIMLKVGLPGVLYEILKGDNQSEHTKQYASQLISALW